MVRIDYVKQHLEVLSDAIADGANVKDTSSGHSWTSSHGPMVMKNVTDSSTLISIHKNAILRNQLIGIRK